MADILTKDVILIPSAYAKYITPKITIAQRRNIRPIFLDIDHSRLYLRKREYMGHTVLDKYVYKLQN